MNNVIEQRIKFYDKYKTSDSQKLDNLMSDSEKVEFEKLEKELGRLNIASMKAQGFNGIA